LDDDLKNDKKETDDKNSWLETWYANNFKVGVIISLILIAFHFFKVLPFNLLLISLFVIILFFFVFPSSIQLTKFKKLKETPYIDFKPEIDIPLIERSFLNVGKRIEIKRWVGEPEFGENSIAPRNIHFKAIEELPSGKTKNVQFTMNVLKRNITTFNDDYSRIESQSRSWSGAEKYDSEKLIRPVYVPRPLQYRPVAETEKEEEKEEGEEEGEEE